MPQHHSDWGLGYVAHAYFDPAKKQARTPSGQRRGNCPDGGIAEIIFEVGRQRAFTAGTCRRPNRLIPYWRIYPVLTKRPHSAQSQTVYLTAAAEEKGERRAADLFVGAVGSERLKFRKA